jgi:hypothetical protein
VQSLRAFGYNGRLRALWAGEMVKYEPPYVVHMVEGALARASAEKGVVYSSGNPDDAEAFASSLYDAGGAMVEVRDSLGQLVRRFGSEMTSAPQN